ncbi:MAG TPA: hypothetical protein VGF17_29130 [Phytomonospora sp.]
MRAHGENAAAVVSVRPIPAPRPPGILALQAGAGNRAVGALLSPTVQRVPTPLSRQQFLAQAGTAVTELGLTTIVASNATFPQVVLDERHRLQQTTAALPPASSVYVGPGPFFDPGDTVHIYGQPGSGCPTGDYQRRWNITPQGAARIAAGEQEHLDDFQYAFDVSLARYAAAVNALAGRRYPNEAAAGRALRARTGVAPADWEPTFYCLIGQSPERDGRRHGWHTPRVRNLDPWPGCRFVSVNVDGNCLPHVGVHPPASFIGGCGEAPAPAARRRS